MRKVTEVKDLGVCINAELRFYDYIVKCCKKLIEALIYFMNGKGPQQPNYNYILEGQKSISVLYKLHQR